MLPTFQPRKPPHRRRKPDVAAAAPLPAVVSVVEVDMIDDNHATWVFSSDITANGANCLQLLVLDHELNAYAPVSIEKTASNQLTVTYDGLVVALDSGWQFDVIAPPAGMTFVDGSLILPQNGYITVPP